MKRTRGLTLMEILVVIVIILLIAALLTPVILNTRKRSYETVCTSNLRQIYTAFALYRQDYGDFPPRIARMKPYIKDEGVLKCPADPYENLAGYIQANMLLKTSYFYFLPEVSSYLRVLQDRDPSHGIIVCVLHGERVSGPLGPAELSFEGKILRLRVDGSVQVAQAENVCFVDADGTFTQVRHPWHLYSDVRPIPQEVIENDYDLRNARIVPCE